MAAEGRMRQEVSAMLIQSAIAGIRLVTSSRHQFSTHFRPTQLIVTISVGAVALCIKSSLPGSDGGGALGYSPSGVGNTYSPFFSTAPSKLLECKNDTKVKLTFSYA